MPSIDDGYGNAATTRNRKSTRGGGSNSEDKRQKKQGEQVRLGNAKYDKDGAYVVIRKPKTKTKSKAVTTPLASTNITQTQGGVLRDGLAPAPSVVNSYSQGDGQMSPALAARQNKASSKKAATSNPSSLAKPLKSVAPTNLAARNYGKFDNSTYQENVASNKNSSMPSMLLSAIKNDKYRNDEVSYNQAYFAARLAGGASQAELKSEQDAIGMKKAYSGDRVITPDMQRRASDDLSRVTGSMAVLDDPAMTAEKKADLTKSGIIVGGVSKTVGAKYGLFGEGQDTTYDYKGGPSIVTRGYDPSLFGVSLGDKTSTTFVNGVEVATKTGGDELGRGATVTKTDGLAKGINDQVEASTDPIEEISSIDDKIKNETDPVILKALHKRRLMLMRMNRTNTRFAGLLGEADTKRTNLMSIS